MGFAGSPYVRLSGCLYENCWVLNWESLGVMSWAWARASPYTYANAYKYIYIYKYIHIGLKISYIIIKLILSPSECAIS